MSTTHLNVPSVFATGSSPRTVPSRQGGVLQRKEGVAVKAVPVAAEHVDEASQPHAAPLHPMRQTKQRQTRQVLRSAKLLRAADLLWCFRGCGDPQTRVRAFARTTPVSTNGHAILSKYVLYCNIAFARMVSTSGTRSDCPTANLRRATASSARARPRAVRKTCAAQLSPSSS